MDLIGLEGKRASDWDVSTKVDDILGEPALQVTTGVPHTTSTDSPVGREHVSMAPETGPLIKAKR